MDKEETDFKKTVKLKMETIEFTLVGIFAVNTIYVAFYLMQLFKMIMV